MLTHCGEKFTPILQTRKGQSSPEFMESPPPVIEKRRRETHSTTSLPIESYKRPKGQDPGVGPSRSVECAPPLGCYDIGDTVLPNRKLFGATDCAY